MKTRVLRFLIPISILAMGLWWSLGPLRYWPFSILGDPDAHAFISNLFPIRLTDPSVHANSNSEAMMQWIPSEMRARLFATLIVSGVSLYLVLVKFKNKESEFRK